MSHQPYIIKRHNLHVLCFNLIQHVVILEKQIRFLLNWVFTL